MTLEVLQVMWFYQFVLREFVKLNFVLCPYLIRVVLLLISFKLLHMLSRFVLRWVTICCLKTMHEVPAIIKICYQDLKQVGQY